MDNSAAIASKERPAQHRLASLSSGREPHRPDGGDGGEQSTREWICGSLTVPSILHENCSPVPGMSLNRLNPRRDANERAIVTALRAASVPAWRISAPGLPDILAAVAGQWVLFEVKNKDARGKLTAAQRAFIAAAELQGAPVYVVSSVIGALERINELRRAGNRRG